MNDKAMLVLWLGLAAGFGLALLMWWLDRRSWNQYLIHKAEPNGRTAVCIDGRFFFIVPAREYVETRARAIRGGHRDWWKDRIEVDWSTRGEPLRPGT